MMEVDRDEDVGIDRSVDRGYGMWNVVRDTALEKIKQTKREERSLKTTCDKV